MGAALTSGVRIYHHRLRHSGLFVCHPADFFFAGGSYFDLFPLRGLVSATLIRCRGIRKSPIICGISRCGAGDGDWRLCGADHADKKLILDEVRKQYVVTARAKGVSEKIFSGNMCSATPCCW